MNPISPTPTHKAVQEHYGKIARESGSCCQPSSQQTLSEAQSCCASSAPSEAIHNDLYPTELLNGLPADIANFTAGSGDPISLAKLQNGETVLDLGSGAGLDCFLAARQIGETGHVIGVDMTPEMLKRARDNAARLNSHTVEFREGYLEALPVDDKVIDAIISNCVINLSPDKPQVFREMYRVLKAGGRIAISDIVTNRPLSEEMRKNKEDWCACTSGALPVKEYTEELRKAGFVNIKIEPNIDVIQKAILSGQIDLPQELTTDQLLQSLSNWEQKEEIIIAPCSITASKL